MSNNALNPNEKSKLTKRGQNENAESKKNESLPAKRAALGTLSSNTTRIQPFRAAKVHAALVFNHRYSFNDIHNHILYCVKRILQLSQNLISFNLDFLVSSLQAQASTTSHRTSSEANVFAKVAHSAFNIPSQGFTVYVDEDSSKPTSLAGKRSSSFVSSEKLNLHPAVTALSRQPLTEVFLPPRVQSQLDGNS